MLINYQHNNDKQGLLDFNSSSRCYFQTTYYILLCVGDNVCLRCSFIFNSKQHVFAPLKQYGCSAMVNLQWFPSGCSKHCQIKNDLFRNKFFYSKSIKNCKALLNNPTYNKRHEKVLFCPPTPLKLKGLDRWFLDMT